MTDKRISQQNEGKQMRVIARRADPQTRNENENKIVIARHDSLIRTTNKSTKSVKIEKDVIELDEEQERHNVTILENNTLKPKKRGLHLIIDESLDENLLDDGNEIKKIYHVSDIHISRYDDRHDEYLFVFKNLVNEIKKDMQHAVIVLCGDILHEKNMLSPQQLLLTKNFFIMLSDLLPCFVIIGNHDISPHGNTIDSLTPILKNLDTKNRIYLLLEDKCYHYNNLTFGVTSMFTKEVTPCTVENKIKIGLYHGTLKGTKLQNGYELSESGMFNMSDFKKYYDYVLLGDIHKHMYLDAKRTVAYSGSLIQTCFGEDLVHGIIKWDLVKKNSKFIKIHNDWGFVNLQCNEKGIVGNLKNLPKNPIIKMEYENITMSDADKYANILRTKYNAKCDLITIMSKNIDIKIGNGKNQKKLLDINNNETVLQMIIDYAKNNYKYNSKVINDMSKSISDLIKSIEYDYICIVKKFVLERLQFSNFFNFGENNEINYENLNGIVGINGNSFVGKSTACVDALLYAIFGKCPRGDKIDTINVDKKYMSTTVEFSLNGENYKIDRKRNVRGNGTKRTSIEKVVLYKNEVNISKESTDVTNKEIEKITCGYKVFIDTAIMLQNGATSFVDLSDTERKDLICGMLNLNVFNAISKFATNKRGKINYLLSEGNYPTIDRLNNMKTSLEINKYEFNELAGNILSLENDLRLITEEIREYMICLERLNFDKNDFLRIRTNINKLKKEMNDVLLSYDSNMNEKDICDNKLFCISQEKEKYDELLGKYENVEERNNQFQKSKQYELQLLNNQVEDLLSRRIPTTNKLSQKIIRSKLMEVNEKLKIVNKKILFSENKLNELQNKIYMVDKPQGLDDGYESFCVYEQISNRLNDEIDAVKKKLTKMEIKHKKLDTHEYDPDCEYCMNYPVTVEKIACNDEIDILQNKLDNLNEENDNNNIQLTKFTKFRDTYDEYCRLSNENDIYQIECNNVSEDLRGSLLERETHERKNHEYEEMMRINNENNQIDQEYKKIKEQIFIVERKINNEFIDYHKIKEKRSNNIDQINILQKDSYDLEKDITFIMEKKDKLKKELDKFSDYTDAVDEYEELASHIAWLRSDMKDRNVQLGEIKQQLNKLKDDNMTLCLKIESMEERLKEYAEKIHERDILDIIIKIIGKQGLVEDILTNNIIPKIENDINALIETIMNYRISIAYNNGIFRINKVSDGKYININTLSGCEKFMTNICFKMILENYNNRFKINVLVLDELFNCCDSDNIDKIESIFDTIKKQYSFVMVISHDDRIKKLYDTTIDVIRENNVSNISFS